MCGEWEFDRPPPGWVGLFLCLIVYNNSKYLLSFKQARPKPHKKKSESKGTAAAQLCPSKHLNATQGASTVLVSVLLNFLNGRGRGSLASLIVSSLLIKVQVVKTF